MPQKCRDCDHEHQGLFLFFRRDGRCSHCHGQGIFVTPINAVTNILSFGNLDAKTTCEFCHGTGQCQICGGNRVVHKDDSSDFDEMVQTHDQQWDESQEPFNPSHSDSFYTNDESAPTLRRFMKIKVLQFYLSFVVLYVVL